MIIVITLKIILKILMIIMITLKTILIIMILITIIIIVIVIIVIVIIVIVIQDFNFQDLFIHVILLQYGVPLSLSTDFYLCTFSISLRLGHWADGHDLFASNDCNFARQGPFHLSI